MKNLKSHTLSVALYLDTRRVKKNGKFPVKLSVYSQLLNLRKLFPTNYEFTENEFLAVYKNSKVSAKHREMHNELKSFEVDKHNLAKSIVPFSFERFAELQDIGFHDSTDVLIQMSLRHSDALANNKHNSNWQTSKNSIIAYQEHRAKRKIDSLKFAEIDSSWLKGYENYMVGKHKTYTTVAIYLRNLQTIFNEAMSKGVHPLNSSPFGRGKYVIPETTKVNKALSVEQIEKFFILEHLTENEQMSRDYWFFSFLNSGMNLIDISMLENKDLDDGILSFERWKIKNNRRTRISFIRIPLDEFSKTIVEKYHVSGSPFLFPIFENLPTVGGVIQNWSRQHYYRNKDFNKKLNRGLKSISLKLGLTEAITMYWARHTFATVVANGGRSSIVEISQMLGHKNIKTTQGYLGNMDLRAKKEVSNYLLTDIIKFKK